MESSCKRHRGANYTSDEKNCLLNIISQYKGIIENKKTDAVTWKEKEDTWQKIANNFNSFGKNTFRSIESLRKCYDNLKKEVRKNVAAKKIEIIKTGGGVPVPISHDGNEDLLLSIINEKSVLGLNNCYDSDQTPSGTTEPMNHVELPLNEVIDVEDTCQIENINWGDFKVSYLKTPINAKLQKEPATTSTSKIAQLAIPINKDLEQEPLAASNIVHLETPANKKLQQESAASTSNDGPQDVGLLPHL